jgi:hypothetical protein
MVLADLMSDAHWKTPLFYPLLTKLSKMRSALATKKTRFTSSREKLKIRYQKIYPKLSQFLDLTLIGMNPQSMS